MTAVKKKEPRQHDHPTSSASYCPLCGPSAKSQDSGPCFIDFLQRCRQSSAVGRPFELKVATGGYDHASDQLSFGVSIFVVIVLATAGLSIIWSSQVSAGNDGKGKAHPKEWKQNQENEKEHWNKKRERKHEDRKPIEEQEREAWKLEEEEVREARKRQPEYEKKERKHREKQSRGCRP